MIRDNGAPHPHDRYSQLTGAGVGSEELLAHYTKITGAAFSNEVKARGLALACSVAIARVEYLERQNERLARAVGESRLLPVLDQDDVSRLAAAPARPRARKLAADERRVREQLYQRRSGTVVRLPNRDDAA